MTRDELISLLEYNPRENERLFMPNEIFSDFPSAFASSSHIAFAYGVYFLASYMYRFAKYGNMNATQGMYQSGFMKEVLGYASNYKALDVITKKGGILDCIGYTVSSEDYPVHWDYNDFDGLVFAMYSDIDKATRAWLIANGHRRQRIKVPVKGLQRYEESKGRGWLDGTFYSFECTTCIPVEVFLTCMCNEDLGVSAFYIYSFMKYKQEFFRRKFALSKDQFVKETGIKEGVLTQRLKALEDCNMIEVERTFITGTREHATNVYGVNKWSEFANSKMLA